MANRKTLSASLLISLLILITVPSQYSFAANSVQYKAWGFECGVTIMDPHISTSLEEKGKGRNIKIDAYSKCKIMQRNVVLTVELFKSGLLSPRALNSTSTLPRTKSSSGFQVNNFDTHALCTTSKPTRFWGRARGVAIINGKQYMTPWVQSGVTKPIACGT